MDLELTDEQTWLSESLTTLLRARVAARGDRAHRDAASSATRLWAALLEFGLLDDELGAVELCLAARRSARTWPPRPFLGSAALRYAGVSDDERVAIALPGTAVEHADRGRSLRGRRRGHARAGRRGRRDDRAGGLARHRHPAVHRDLRRRRAAVEADVATAHRDRRAARRRRVRRRGRADARRRARLRGRAPPVRPHDRQLPGAAPHPGRHVRAPASAWSTVLYAAAALDDDLPDAQRTAAIAKAYVARAAREVAHGALQVFGGIAFTAGASGAPLPAAHRRPRAAVRGRRAPRARARPRPRGLRAGAARGMTETGFNDPTAQRLERITHRRRPGGRRPAARRRAARPALAATATSR